MSRVLGTVLILSLGGVTLERSGVNGQIVEQTVDFVHHATAQPRYDCPVAVSASLPELTGTWQVLRISGLDRPHPDSAMSRSTFSTELQRCLIRETLRAESGAPPYEALILWGANGADGGIERIFAHSQHGRFGIYEGRRIGGTITLRQLSTSPQPPAEVVEHQVLIRDADHFAIVSRLSSDAGRRWTMLSRWEYRRM